MSRAIRPVELVPFVDLGPSHTDLKQAILDEVAELIDSGAFVNGPPVARFEAAFADYCRRETCVGVASGLDALRLTLLAAELESGSEVVVPANTFVATFEAIAQARLVPVPADASEDDYNLDPAAAGAAVTSRTSALLPVHLYGQLADMTRILELARAQGLFVLEDACQAHGAERDGLRAGAAGDAAAFSFYPGKNLGAMGDAGAVVTDDGVLAAHVRALRENGQTAKYTHVYEGYTSRLDSIQAAVLAQKLPRLDGWNEDRARVAAAYATSLDGVGDLVLPPVPSGSVPVWHLYVVRTGRRDELAQFLAEHGIATGKHYPEPPHLSAAYASLGYVEGAFPVAERLARELLSLPIYPGMPEQQVVAVTDAVCAFFMHG